jgi:wyosine [tRNA(Phe)-imidazoG37] synthetase (radical SAM superfamily)
VATCERKEYIPVEEISEELKTWLENNADAAASLDFITLSGAGEPTLNLKIGELIQEIKKISNSKIAVITNASLLRGASVREEIKDADLIVPSLDAASAEIFKKVDNPHPDIRIEDVIEGLVNLRREFRGRIWLEVMLVKGVNDDLRQIKKLKEVIERINPDKIQLNSPVRSTAEENILPVDKNKLKKIKEILGDKCEII